MFVYFRMQNPCVYLSPGIYFEPYFLWKNIKALGVFRHGFVHSIRGFTYFFSIPIVNKCTKCSNTCRRVELFDNMQLESNL